MLSPIEPNTDISSVENNAALAPPQMPVDFRQAFLERLKTPGTIKPISSSAMRLLEACRNPSGKITELVELIEADPAIATRTLALANSPVYGQTRMISSIKQAVVVLGMTSISQLATSFALTDTYLDEGDAAPEIKAHRQALFFHSLGTASVARNLASILGTTDEGTAYLAGALHDLGKQIFWELIPEEYQALHQWSHEHSVYELESKILGLTHEEVGEFCAQNWGLPQEIVLSIGYHHRPKQASEEQSIVQIVESANYFARLWGVGSDPMPVEPEEELPVAETEEGAEQGDVEPPCSIQLDETQQQACIERSLKELKLILQACGIKMPEADES